MEANQTNKSFAVWSHRCSNVIVGGVLCDDLVGVLVQASNHCAFLEVDPTTVLDRSVAEAVVDFNDGIVVSVDRSAVSLNFGPRMDALWQQIKSGTVCEIRTKANAQIVSAVANEVLNHALVLDGIVVLLRVLAAVIELFARVQRHIYRYINLLVNLK